MTIARGSQSRGPHSMAVARFTRQLSPGIPKTGHSENMRHPLLHKLAVARFANQLSPISFFTLSSMDSAQMV